MGNLESLVTGLSQGLTSYLQAGQQQQRQQQNTKFESDTQLNQQEQLSKFKQGQEGTLTPEMGQEMFSQVSPEFGQAAFKAITDFKQNKGRDMTLDEANKFMDPVMKGLMMKQEKAGAPDKASEHQDALEKQALDRITQVRGDQSLMRAEKQRDAAGMAYDTIAKAKSEQRPLTQLEQSDLIGQLWQARAGKAPTDQDMKEMQDQTAKRGFNHMVTWLTGDPSLVGASTDETLANLSQFVDSTGKKADQQFEGYMKTRLTKPTGLEDARWEHIGNQTRGISYGHQKETSDKTYKSSGNSTDAKRAALRAKLGL